MVTTHPLINFSQRVVGFYLPQTSQIRKIVTFLEKVIVDDQKPDSSFPDSFHFLESITKLQVLEDRFPLIVVG